MLCVVHRRTITLDVSLFLALETHCGRGDGSTLGRGKSNLLEMWILRTEYIEFCFEIWCLALNTVKEDNVYKEEIHPVP